MNVNHQMTEVYGMNTERCCKECKHFDPQTKVCYVARAEVISFWVACGRFLGVDKGGTNDAGN